VKPTRKSPARKKTPVKSGAPERPKRVRRNPERLIAAILNAAIEEFSNHGFSGARIDRISKRANTVDRMLYYYFGNKERLYEAVLEEVYRNLIEEQRQFVPPEGDPVNGMDELITHMWEHYMNHPEFIRLVMSENLLYGRYIRQSEHIKQVSFPLVRIIDEILKSGKKKNIFRPDADTNFILMTIMSMGFFYVSNQYTYTYWLSKELTPNLRSDAWLGHMKTVIFDHLMVR